MLTFTTAAAALALLAMCDPTDLHHNEPSTHRNPGATTMQIDKQQILTLLQTLGQHDKAGAADAELPDQVDTEQHSGILDKLGINVSDLLGGGGAGGTGLGGLGGIAGKLGL